MTYEEYWAKLDEIGWVKYIPTDMLSDIQETLKENLSSKSGMRYAFLALTTGGFDAEHEGYESSLEELNELSKGRFEPVKIKEKEGDESAIISFEQDKKKYKCEVELTGWFDASVLKVCNDALADRKVEERFIMFPAADQFINLVFMPPDIYKAAVDSGLIVTKKSKK